MMDFRTIRCQANLFSFGGGGEGGKSCILTRALKSDHAEESKLN